jgi:hypothetical protein
LKAFPGSTLGVIDSRVRVVASEALEAFSETLLDAVVLETLESREGGRASGKVAVAGDCILDDGLDATTGEEGAALLPELLLAAAALDAGDVPALPVLLLGPWCGWSLPPPTEALKRLYSPLKPPCTSSMPLASLALDGDGGAVNSSKVVSVSERDAVACIWWSESCSDPRREFLAMAAVVCGCRGTWRVYQQCVKGSIGLLLVGIHGLREGGQVFVLVTGAMGWRAVIVVAEFRKSASN